MVISCVVMICFLFGWSVNRLLVDQILVDQLNSQLSAPNLFLLFLHLEQCRAQRCKARSMTRITLPAFHHYFVPFKVISKKEFIQRAQDLPGCQPEFLGSLSFLSRGDEKTRDLTGLPQLYVFFFNSLLLFDFSVCSYFNPPKNNSSQQRKMKLRQSYIFIPSPWRYGASVCLCAYFFWSYLFLNQMYPNQCITDFITKTSLISCFFFFNHIFSWYVQGAVIFRAKDIVLLCDLLSCSLIV